MKKRTLYIIIPILVLAFFFAVSGECKGGRADSIGAKRAVEEVGKSFKKATDEVADVMDGGETKQEEVAVIEDILEEEQETGSSQPEDVQDLKPIERKGTTTLSGKIDCRNEISFSEITPITITIDWEKDSVGGEATLFWYEYIEVAEEGGESHHSHKYVCRIEVKGTIMGDIDKDDNINATISGNAACDYGYDPKVAEYSDAICDLCREKFNNKFMTFKLTGKYHVSSAQVTHGANGVIVENGWKWEVN